MNIKFTNGSQIILDDNGAAIGVIDELRSLPTPKPAEPMFNKADRAFLKALHAKEKRVSLTDSMINNLPGENNGQRRTKDKIRSREEAIRLNN